MKMTAFWNTPLCSLAEVDQHFIRGAHCLHLQVGDDPSSPSSWRQYAPLKRQSTSMRLHGPISQLAVIFTFTTVRTWNLETKKKSMLSICTCHFFLSSFKTLTTRTKAVVSSKYGRSQWGMCKTKNTCTTSVCRTETLAHIQMTDQNQ
jgi:hypothetical protein